MTNGKEPAGRRDLENQPGVTYLAVFSDVGRAQDCLEDLRRQVPEAEAVLLSRGEQGEGSQPAVGGLGNGMAVGATLGATAGLLAATYMLSPVGTAVTAGPMLSTLAGAGIGSFLGGLADEPANETGGQERAAGPSSEGILLLAHAEADQSHLVSQTIGSWQPESVQVH